MNIRPERPADSDAVFAVEAAAFGREDEAELVRTLQAAGLEIASLVAEASSGIVGHVLFTRLEVTVDGRDVPAAALAPMAVRPDRQKSGVGAALVQAGLAAMREAGVQAVVVLGHPDYYPRFGFRAEAAAHLQAPFSGEAFMALALSPGALEGTSGRVRYPSAWGL